MAKFQIQLNGSNITSEERQRKFQDALNSEHQIDCGDGAKLTVSESTSPAQEPAGAENRQSDSVKEVPEVNGKSSSQLSSHGISRALDHTYNHQARTMEIHQQYISQQAEYLQLITTVLNQQGKVLDNGNGHTGTVGILESLQRTLDNFHTLREQGLRVHQDFLAQQADFSDRFLTALEGGQPALRVKAIPTGQKTTSAPDPIAAEWVVQEPPIVLDEQVPEAEHTSPTRAAKVPALPPQASKRTETISTQDLSEALLQIVADKTGYPAEMLELNMDLEADLGIDSIKRVEILGALEDQFPTLPAADTEVLAQTRTLQQIVDYMNLEAGSPSEAPDPDTASREAAPQMAAESAPSPAKATPSNSGHSVTELTAVLLEIVAEKTGYPAEMLEADMDMEADLGIDSIKRVEILGAMEDQVPGLPAIEAEVLAELRTLGQIVTLMSSSKTGPNLEETPAPEEKKKADQLEVQNTPVKLVSLPEPDRLEFTPSPLRPIIITDDGTDTAPEVARQLTSEGWKVILWIYPKDLLIRDKRTLPRDIEYLTQEQPGKEAINSLLEVLRAKYGEPAGLIHLHPPGLKNGLFSDQEEEIIKQVFLMTGSIKTDLNHLESGARNYFLSVTRTDGALGLRNNQTFQEGSGLSGLVKTLNWEWPDVFCRFVDLSPEFSSQEVGGLLLQEVRDPDRGVTEVGISKNGRSTIVRENGR